MEAARDRFVIDTPEELQVISHNPILGYENEPLLSLEEATEPITPFIPNITEYVSKAKENCNRKSLFLTWDESAAIYLYTMPTSLYKLLNQALRTENQCKIKPWFPFLKLLLTALGKLPPVKKQIWRGASVEEGAIFADGDVHIWWTINSCSKDLGVIETFLGQSGTIFSIDAVEGKDITEFSMFLLEKEVVLMPGTHVRACAKSLSFHGSYFLVHLKEESEERLV